MTFTEFATVMYPYWVFGICMIISIYFSKFKYLIRIQKSAVLKWIKLISIATLIRFIVFYYLKYTGEELPDSLGNITTLPWQSAFTVFWEDAVHTLPIAIMMDYIGTEKWYNRLLFFLIIFYSTIDFGMGHLYQGIYASIVISLYVPISLFLGRKYGFGTIMSCHVIYDAFTIFTAMYFLR